MPEKVEEEPTIFCCAQEQNRQKCTRQGKRTSAYVVALVNPEDVENAYERSVTWNEYEINATSHAYFNDSGVLRVRCYILPQTGILVEIDSHRDRG